ncbi:S-adenosyl-L-methionine-dependent methyltransferase [Rickenella mellea]|uniref:S-adenosyl-L-methionine-dependent methyltransferase n=1 Tax=Rickenella mellea TaxID=50990 RepID=A0A4Y7Q7A5_9AGAM|nr:S-adenosyl-L-methionine-dependent methyltransferase [Rickenella mellea]
MSGSETSNEQDCWSAQAYNKTASFVYSSAFTAPVLELLDIKPGENIIDFGCGSGELTIKLSGAVGDAGLVVGVDASEDMISKAQKNGFKNCFVADIQNLTFPPSVAFPQHNYDAVFTNAALHWCKRDPQGVIRSAKRVLKKGGRFVGEMGGFTNCIGLRMAIHHVLRNHGQDPLKLDPWYFPSVQDYRNLLESTGFRVAHISLHPRFTPLNGSIVDWLKVFCRKSMLNAYDDAEAEGIMKEIENMCAIDCRDESGNWAMMYTRLRFVALLD